MIQDVIDHDTILIPFFPDKQAGEGHATVLVTLTPSKWRADLFQSEARATEVSSDTGNPIVVTISQEVINIFSAIASLTGREFNETMIDGGLNSVCVTCDEDYMIAMVYIADCLTFKRNIDLETFNVNRERNKMVDTFLTILDFE